MSTVDAFDHEIDPRVVEFTDWILLDRSFHHVVRRGVLHRLAGLKIRDAAREGEDSVSIYLRDSASRAGVRRGVRRS
jgi:hypothetical protein